MNTDLQHYLWFVICQGARIIFSMMGMALLARLLGPRGLGQWAMITAAATLLHVVFVNWIQQDPLLRFGRAEWIKTGSIGKSWAVRLPLMGVGIAIAIFLFTVSPGAWSRRLFQLSHSEALLAFAFFISIVVTIEAQTFLQLIGRMRELAFVPVLTSAGTLILYLALWFSPIKSHRLEVSLLGVSALTLGIWLVAALGDSRQGHLGAASWDSALAASMLRFAWPILPTAILGYSVNWGNQVLIQRSFTSSDVGLYQSAFQVHSLLVTLAIPLTTIISPKLIGRHLEDPGIMKRYAGSIAPTLLAVWFIAIIPVVTVLPAVFILIFSRAFRDSLPVLNALLCATPLCALGQLYTVLYTVQGRMGKIFTIVLFMSGFNLIAAWVIFPHRSIRDIAIAFSLAFVLAQYLTCFYQHRHLGEPLRKIHALLIPILLFSAGQFLLHGLVLRLLWGAAALFFLTVITRRLTIVDPDVLRHLFAGRLQKPGLLLQKLLVIKAGAH